MYTSEQKFVRLNSSAGYLSQGATAQRIVEFPTISSATINGHSLVLDYLRIIFSLSSQD